MASNNNGMASNNNGVNDAVSAAGKTPKAALPKKVNTGSL